ncbi:MAG: ribosome silencing factor [Candidatus Omnitrophica bacterium]|nr:ribosome silencing factor [Candidatus Omnitrophota bacterium]
MKALKVAQFALDKKAKHTIILDVSKISGLCDYFVICSAETGTQAVAILDWVADKAKENNFKMHHFEKDELSEWVLGDFSDVILHVFVNEARKFYNLEHLWADAKKIRITRKKESGSSGKNI